VNNIDGSKKTFSFKMTIIKVQSTYNFTPPSVYKVTVRNIFVFPGPQLFFAPAARCY